MKYYPYKAPKQTPQIQGKLTELLLCNQLGVFHDWFLLRDVLIPTKFGTTQIDYLIVTNRCIFVVELKSFHGLIVGCGNSKNWKHYYKNVEYDYYNPIFQNQQHINHLRYFLKDIPFSLHYHSMIFMLGIDNAKLDMKPPYPPDTSVVNNYTAFMRLIQFVCEKKKMNLTMEETKLLFDYIRLHQIHGQDARDEHMKFASNFHPNVKFENGICPLCNGKLVIRNGKNGKFYGCSNFPKCRYTHNI